MTVVGFSRPLPEDEDGAQVAALRAAGAARVFAPRTGVTAWDRAALAECVDQLVAGDVLMVTDASRLAPSLAQFVSAVSQLDARGIFFRSLSEPALSTDPAVERASPADVLRELDQFRHRLRSTRTRTGMKVAAASGRRPGRPSVMTVERIALARELRGHDRSIAHIARVLGVSRSAVQRVLRDTA